MGLREQSILRRKARVMSAISSLMGRKRFEDITMDEIAGRAGISVGTLYNYFGSKDDLVMAFCRQKMEGSFQEARRLVDDPQRPASAAISDFLDIYMRGFGTLDRALVGRLITASLAREHDGRGITGFENHATTQLRQLLLRLQRTDALPGALQMDQVVFILFGLFRDLLYQYTLSSTMELDAQRVRLAQCIDLVFRGLGARNASQVDDPDTGTGSGDANAGGPP